AEPADEANVRGVQVEQSHRGDRTGCTTDKWLALLPAGLILPKNVKLPPPIQKRLLVSGGVIASVAVLYLLLDLVPDLNAEQQKFTFGILLIFAAPLVLCWNRLAHALRIGSLVVLCLAAFGTM